MASEISRRAMLALTGSVAVTAVMPSTLVKASVEATVPSATKLSWLVGTPGEFDYQHIVAKTAEEARLRWVNDRVGGNGCDVEDEIKAAGGLEAYLADGGEPPAEYCDCEWCNAFHGCEADRISAWDGRPEGTPTHGDWLRAGLGSICDRCGYECSESEGTGFPIGDKAVCEECMTIPEWQIVNPGHAAELEADMAEEDATRRALTEAETEADRG